MPTTILFTRIHNNHDAFATHRKWERAQCILPAGYSRHMAIMMLFFDRIHEFRIGSFTRPIQICELVIRFVRNCPAVDAPIRTVFRIPFPER